MTETEYGRMMMIYLVILVVSYSLFFLLEGSARQWAIFVALCTAVTGLIKALQHPYNKTDKDTQS